MSSVASESPDEADDVIDERDEDALSEDPAICPACSLQQSSVRATIAHLLETHAFDFRATAARLQLDQYGCIKLVNFLRTHSKDQAAWQVVDGAVFQGDELLKPVLENDAFLFFDFEDEFGSQPNPTAHSVTGPSVEELQDELARLRMMFEQYRSVTAPALFGGVSLGDLRAEDELQAATLKNKSSSKNDPGDYYFSSYSHYGIHETMLKDTHRTESYRDFMYKNPSLFNGKVVLDVGCGTGILSMFAARAGAKLVIGVDNSDVIHKARLIVKENGLDDKVVLIRGKVEEVTLPVGEVDIIISEWMGYFLIFESMLDTVLFARDKWLTKDGIVLPDQASMYMIALSDETHYKQRISFWDDVYGFKMSCMKQNVLRDPEVDIIDPNTVVSAPYLFKDMNMSTVQVADLQFTQEFQLVVKDEKLITAFCSYFDTIFDANAEHTVILTTSPFTQPTHWKQVVFILDHPFLAKPGDVINGKLKCSRHHDDPRSLAIDIDYQVQSLDGNANERRSQQFDIAA